MLIKFFLNIEREAFPVNFGGHSSEALVDHRISCPRAPIYTLRVRFYGWVVIFSSLTRESTLSLVFSKPPLKYSACRWAFRIRYQFFDEVVTIIRVCTYNDIKTGVREWIHRTVRRARTPDLQLFRAPSSENLNLPGELVAYVAAPADVVFALARSPLGKGMTAKGLQSGAYVRRVRPRRT